ncbi:hypothetical protein [Halosimplex halophilum]|uniref:hypothetical protein n=1 Tax=Halosimplex halophilum TaxID=2559572 RepID=UPI00107EF655|nr:hypothetical protein [Halosimplex halophilum]
MPTRFSRRSLLRSGALLTGAAVAGCASAPGTDPLFAEGFEESDERWTRHGHIGPEESQDAFEWDISLSEERAAAGEWSLAVFTEGDHDDGVAWVTAELPTPEDPSTFSVSFRAWSESESFNVLRNAVAYLGPEEPTEEGDFPDPGANSSAVPDAPYGGLREPLHLAEGWREYAFDWDPDEAPERLFLSVGVAVVWEADATHYVDDIEVTAE